MLIFIVSYLIGFSIAQAQQFCPVYRHSGTLPDDAGMYQRIHPDGQYMLTSNGYGSVIDLRNWSSPQIRRTAANDELYPVEGSWKLVASPNVDRLNLGAVPTNQVHWDQPHEGNLFEHLYARRAFQRAASA